MWQCCQHHFARRSTLERHKRSKHSGGQTKHRCFQCAKIFARRDILLRHQSNVHGDGFQACLYCGGTFRSDYLKQHEPSCERKHKLPGQSVILNLCRSTRPQQKSKANDAQDMQQCLQVSREQFQALLKPSRIDEGSPGALATITTHEAMFDSVHRIVDFRGDSQERIEVDLEDECPNSSYAKVVEAMQYEVPIYDKYGRVGIDSGPSRLVDYPPPPPPPFFVAAVQEIQEYSPELNVVAIMKSYLVNTRNNEVYRYNVWDFDIPQGIERQMVPCIFCKDCEYTYIVSDPEEIYWEFSTDHTRERSHKEKLRRRLLLNSRTVREAVFLITKKNFDKFHHYIRQLVDGKLSVRKFGEDYFDCCSVRIFTLAVEHDEIQIFSYFLDQIEDTSPASDRKIVLNWANSFSRLNIAKILIYKGFDDILHQRSEEGFTILDKWIQMDQVTTAVDAVEFAASHRSWDTAPLTLACFCGQHEIIAAMLRADADPNPDVGYGDGPLSRALKFARVESVRMLLEVGAKTDQIDDHIMLGLRKRAAHPSSEMSPFQYPDAADKIVLLEQYGVETDRCD